MPRSATLQRFLKQYAQWQENELQNHGTRITRSQLSCRYFSTEMFTANNNVRNELTKICFVVLIVFPLICERFPIILHVNDIFSSIMH